MLLLVRVEFLLRAERVQSLHPRSAHRTEQSWRRLLHGGERPCGVGELVWRVASELLNGGCCDRMEEFGRRVPCFGVGPDRA